jgi:hypothetical protein
LWFLSYNRHQPPKPTKKRRRPRPMAFKDAGGDIIMNMEDVTTTSSETEED